MSRESTVTVRFKTSEAALDPDDPLDTACSRTPLGGGFSPAIRDAAVAEAQTTRLTLSIGASLNGGRARTLSSSTGSGVTGQLSAQVQTGFDEQADPGIRFAAGAFCRDYIRTLCWQPTPLDWPELHPNQLVIAETEYAVSAPDAPAVWLDAIWDGAGGLVFRDYDSDQIVDQSLSVRWPWNIYTWVEPRPYGLVITDHIAITEGRTAPVVGVSGPEFTEDIGDFLADRNPGTDITGSHGTRVPYRYVAVDDATLNRVTLIESIATPRGTYPLDSGSPSVSGLDLVLDALRVFDGAEYLTTNDAAIYDLHLEILPAYGRVHFAAMGYCQTTEADDLAQAVAGQLPPDSVLIAGDGTEPVLADMWSAFERPRPLTETPVSTAIAFNVWVWPGSWGEDFNVGGVIFSGDGLSVSAELPASSSCGGQYSNFSIRRYYAATEDVTASATISASPGLGLGGRAHVYVSELYPPTDGPSHGTREIKDVSWSMTPDGDGNYACDSPQTSAIESSASAILYAGGYYEITVQGFAGSPMPAASFSAEISMTPA